MKISKVRPGWATATAIFGVAGLGLGSLSIMPAVADTVPTTPGTTIDFESGYSPGDINNQNGWSKTGPYDVEVESLTGSPLPYPDAAGYGFGTFALRSSNATVTGGFGDQTFSPGLAVAAGEAGVPSFTASFKIGTTQALEQSGLYMSVSPDAGDGSRMSYLRFEDRSDGVHVFFDDVIAGGSVEAPGEFTDEDIVTLNRGQSHAVKFTIAFVDGPGNDVVNVFIDGVLEATGTTWEDYYRYEEQRDVPTTSKLLFREGGDSEYLPALEDQGFLIDGVSLSSSTSIACADAFSDSGTTRTLVADCTTDHTIRVPNGWTLDGAGHSITAIDPAGGHFLGAVVANGGTSANVRKLTVTASNLSNDVCDAGVDRLRGILFDNASGSITDNVVTGVEQGNSGCQEGNAIEVRNFKANGSTGTPKRTVTISGNKVSNYQKNGITANGGLAATITGNTVIGDGLIDHIAQNGIQVGYSASATITNNVVNDNFYSPPDYEGCGILLYQAGNVKSSSNTLSGNEVATCGKGGDKGKSTA